MAPHPAEDVRKLHAEVNQILNQRFLLTTLAVTVFGVVSAWMLPRTGPTGKSNAYFSLLGADLLLVLLFLLYLASHALRNVMRTATTYLEVFALSDWERRATAFRADGRYLGYSKIQSTFFIALGLLDGVFFTLSAACRPAKIPLVLSIVLLVAYCVLVLGMGWRGWWYRESALRKKWEKVLAGEAPPSDA